ncbi:MAG: SprT family zinc-dependent metalloprotease [Ghiorsea sp.]|nr:SprT family zinc-dependent metalloprotease [Ghiorsea sp.]
MNTEFPFDWQLRLSKRAKHPRITISSQGLVELVWPHRMSKRHINVMLNEHKLWVVKQLGSIDVQPSIICPPKALHLMAIHQTYDVIYQQNEKDRLHLQEKEQTLVLSGDTQNMQALRHVLNTWVKKKGKLHLLPWLLDVAQDMGVSFAQANIRLQKTRWGSCSNQGHISLNAALLFMPDDLVRHVLIHELTHLKHHNHSAAFWSAVEKFEPDYKKNRILLKEYGKKVPAWLTSALTHDLHKSPKG